MSGIRKKNKEKKAFGLIDSVINKMPEIHIPGYQYCGPGTKLAKRLARGDPGINKLDVACKDHDLAYASCKDTKSRRKADKVLIARAFKRVYSGDAKLNERTAALLVSGLMSAKMGLTKIGLGLGARKKIMKNSVKRRKRKSNRSTALKKKNKRNKKRKKQNKRNKKKKAKKKRKKSIAFSKLVRGARESIKKSKLKSSPLNETIMAAIRSAKDMKRSKTVKMPRVLKLPKFGGGALSILPILSGLSAIGSITASAAGIMKAIKDIENAKKQNMNGEKKIGRGLNLIYSKTNETASGSGFYLKPYHHQQQQQQQQH